MFCLSVGSLLIISVILCANAAKVKNKDSEENDGYYPFTNGSDPFDWQLLKAFASDYKNVLISPISLKIVLALLYEGSSGATEKEFQMTLQFPEQKELLREKFSRILNTLKAAERKEYLLNLGTRVFLDSSIQPQQTYAAKASHYYETDIVPLNFQNLADASKSVNSWIDIITNGRIRQIVQPDDIKNDVMIIANAIYFKGTWMHQFPKNQTKTSAFYLSPTKQVDVSYMTTTDEFFFAESHELDAKILRLPYRGNRYSLFVVLPNTKAGLDDLIKKINVQTLLRSLHSLQKVVVDVLLPKFKFNFQSSFTRYLQNLGLSQMFQNTASFPGIARGTSSSLRMLSVSDIIQKSGIEIDEEGSVVYAATDVHLINKFGEADNVFNATHPFLFFLEEEVNGSILFVGKIENPLANEGNLVAQIEQNDQKPPAAAQAQQSPYYSGPNLQPHINVQDAAILKRFNYFDLELLHAFSESNDNVFISPASIKTVLAMLLEGADGKSALEISKALRLNFEQKESWEQLRRLIYELNEKTGTTVLESANSIFVSDKYKILADYEKKIREYYGADVLPMDFTSGQLTARAINLWVNNATHGLIKEIVTPENFDSEASVVIANALYFKGLWKNSFDGQATRVKCFKTPRKPCANVEMMHLVDVFKYRYIPSLDAQVVELLYSDNKYAMLVLLPSEKSNVQVLTRDLQHIDLTTVVNSLEETEINLEMPKFAIEYNVDLIEHLKQLKVQEIFSANANLSKIVQKQNVKVNNFIHKTKIEVNEKGTIAAAATGAVVIPLIGSSVTPFKIDRPFVFFIYNIESKNIIFEGQLVEPIEVTSNALPASRLQQRFNYQQDNQNIQKTAPQRQYQRQQQPTYLRSYDDIGQQHY